MMGRVYVSNSFPITLKKKQLWIFYIDLVLVFVVMSKMWCYTFLSRAVYGTNLSTVTRSFLLNPVLLFNVNWFVDNALQRHFTACYKRIKCRKNALIEVVFCTSLSRFKSISVLDFAEIEQINHFKLDSSFLCRTCIW